MVLNFLFDDNTGIWLNSDVFTVFLLQLLSLDVSFYLVIIVPVKLQ